MITNFLLAISLISIATAIMLTLDITTNIGTQFIKSTLRFTRRSKILTEYVLRAYIRYRKTINKKLI